MLPIAKYEILGAIHEKGVVAVIRASDKEKGLAVANAVYEGGIPAVEVAMTVPGALDLMGYLAEKHRGSSLILGAGTVLDAPTARACILAGARYIISPSLSEEVAFCCNRYGVPYMPGVGSVTELARAMELGVDVVKVFPGECMGPQFVKAVLGPLPQAHMMPTGGVSEANLEAWFKAGAFAVGMGGSLTGAGRGEGDLEAIGAMASRVVAEIARVRKGR
ncbi:bifunctional 2-keto-4-hydroxyglutarate aldolase/2-keto-3-deoxy-6-phosphogluconate aldolase [Aminithiophilus ramosus]|uniref:Bifunctional 2-keto-4-hydroxyglutarate aldolase/2-keto-3-deoxy-6-phosphogluconate aldolase n=2 Tax=Synergistales TaxID=649776 RepID=A0A9Q7AEL5_9BACT|nr:bifunctional 2-keto-4-hydroxyglutarate aldolase/2-keto-3-deoxy-6-phosphogluconate aldolase [Aminithiophilus ramosus]QTX31879.1 bifunctional 2-keto-4-hydroxyglutarate aldolase/2-keto-3-deoxy-6-phosphogluconate aldolase [Aminithiophilus ramosus]QVL35716.1 bifunctional 2-keto-4-hydroxyglutarate aldolase/2-keto-3-deoxy-6-phosphogluconate aldolase [Synergistota bacterium]